MTADKQIESKVSSMDENKENSPDGGLGLESILCNKKCDCFVLFMLVGLFRRRLTLASRTSSVEETRSLAS